MSIFDKVYNERIKLYENLIGSKAQPGVPAPKATASPVITPKTTTATTATNPTATDATQTQVQTQPQTPAPQQAQAPQQTQTPTIDQALKALIIAKQQGALDDPNVQKQINDAVKKLSMAQ